MRGKRPAPPHVAWVVALSLLVLVACSRESPERQAEALARADEVREIAQDTFATIGTEIRATSYTSAGSGVWGQCGMDPSPSGAEYTAKVAITGSASRTSEIADDLSEALEDTGWTVTSSGADTLRAEQGRLDFTSSYGTGGINLNLSTGCIDLSVADVRALNDRPVDDLDLSLPGQD